LASHPPQAHGRALNGDLSGTAASGGGMSGIITIFTYVRSFGDFSGRHVEIKPGLIAAGDY